MKKKVKPRIRCKHCDELFEQQRGWQYFCSRKCQWANWNENHPRTEIKRGET